MTLFTRSLRGATALSLCSAVVGVLVFLTGSPAAAHASLLSTDPKEGSVVQQVPDQIVLTFNEPIRLSTGGVTAFDPTGDDWEVDAQAQDNRLVVTPSSDPGQGTVVVAWKVISADGHEVSGALTFSVGAASSDSDGPATDASPRVPTSVNVARWIATGTALAALLGLLGLVGVVLLGVGLPSRWTHHGLLRALDLLWNVALVGAVLVVPLEQLAKEGRSLGGMFDWLTWINGLAVGRSLLLLAAVLAAAVLVRIARRIARPLGRPRVGVLRVAASVLTALSVAGAVTFLITWPDQSTSQTDAVPARQASSTKQSTALGSAGSVNLTVRQHPGEAVRLDIQLTDGEGRPLKPYAPPTATVANDDIGLGEVNLASVGPGHYRGTVTIPQAGAWSAQVSVRTSEFDNPVAVVPFTIG